MTIRVTFYLDNGAELETSVPDHQHSVVVESFSGAWGNNPNRGMVNIYGDPHMLVNAASIAAVTLAQETE